jgi:hypothetical protein
MNKPFARATRVANTMLAVDIVLSLLFMRESGSNKPVSLALSLLPPAWSALVFALLLTWVKPIRPSSRPEFPTNITYPLLSAALLFSMAVLTCGKSPSIVALEAEAAALTLWTNYPFVVISAIAKIATMTAWLILASRSAERSNPGRSRSE